jgi:hypothetical protein
MYRIFCESYGNYMKDFNHNDTRLKNPVELELISDEVQFKNERAKNSLKYKKTCDLLYCALQNIDKYPRFQAFLWTIESRGMLPEYFGVSDKETMEEQLKIINSFLHLAYWK